MALTYVCLQNFYQTLWDQSHTRATLKRQNTLGGLEISIRPQIVNTPELIVPSPPPPPQKKIWWSFKQQILHVASEKWSHCETVYWLKLAHHAQYTGLSDVTGSLTVKSCHLCCGCLVDIVSFFMCICNNIQDSVAIPVLLPIDIEDAHYYWNVVYDTIDVLAY